MGGLAITYINSAKYQVLFFFILLNNDFWEAKTKMGKFGESAYIPPKYSFFNSYYFQIGTVKH